LQPPPALTTPPGPCRCDAPDRVYAFVEQNYLHHISLRDVAQAVGTRLHLTTTFRRVTGTPVTAWIIKRRITPRKNSWRTAISTSRRRAKPPALPILLTSRVIRSAMSRDAGRFAQRSESELAKLAWPSGRRLLISHGTTVHFRGSLNR